jgi:hypothetical protein
VRLEWVLGKRVGCELMTITQCLTKKPRLKQNIELRAIALTLSKTDEATFEGALADWRKKHGKWLKERDSVTRTNAHANSLDEPTSVSLETYRTYSHTKQITCRNIQLKRARK